jgi:hypothetical protein
MLQDPSMLQSLAHLLANPAPGAPPSAALSHPDHEAGSASGARVPDAGVNSHSSSLT